MNIKSVIEMIAYIFVYSGIPTAIGIVAYTIGYYK